MARTAVIHLVLDVDEQYSADDVEDAKEEVEQKVRDWAREFADVRRLSVLLTGWPKREDARR